MNKNLKNITLRRQYAEMYWHRFFFIFFLFFIFLKETFLVYPTLTNFTQRKGKTYDANDLMAVSLVGVH